MASKPQTHVNLAALLRMLVTARINSATDTAGAAPEAQRALVAHLLHDVDALLKGTLTTDLPLPLLPEGIKLSPRMRQTLDRLLVGDSEKQIAARLAVSKHTVHVYIKALYRSFNVTSRGELLAHFVRIPPPPAVQPRRGRPSLGKP